MTLDEAIKKCEEAAQDRDKLRKSYDDASGYSRSHNESIRTNDAKECEKCSQDFRQIAEWLKELKAYKEREHCDDVINRKAAVVQLHHNKTGDDDIDVIIEKDIATIQTLPPCTPKQKKGKWKLVQIGKRVDLCCANCGTVRIEEIAYNYTIDELNKFFKDDFKEYLKHPDMSYCPCCGAEMEGEKNV